MNTTKTTRSVEEATTALRAAMVAAGCGDKIVTVTEKTVQEGYGDRVLWWVDCEDVACRDRACKFLCTWIKKHTEAHNGGSMYMENAVQRAWWSIGD